MEAAFRRRSLRRELTAKANAGVSMETWLTTRFSRSRPWLKWVVETANPAY
jgi:hypothetical protein